MANLSYIQLCVPREELLAGLAEEAAELAQASLKYRRALDGTNPTPVMPKAAYDGLLEEVADVLLYLATLDILEAVEVDRRTNIHHSITKKLDRWEKRLRSTE